MPWYHPEHSLLLSWRIAVEVPVTPIRGAHRWPTPRKIHGTSVCGWYEARSLGSGLVYWLMEIATSHKCDESVLRSLADTGESASHGRAITARFRTACCQNPGHSSLPWYPEPGFGRPAGPRLQENSMENLTLSRFVRTISRGPRGYSTDHSGSTDGA